MPPLTLPNAGFEVADADGKPAGWGLYQWGRPPESGFSTTIEEGAGRDGTSALRAENLDATARAGAYTHVRLEPGRYRLTVWARVADGETGKAAMHLGNAYSRPFKLTGEWRQLAFVNPINETIERAEINVQNRSDKVNVVWFDDVRLEGKPPRRYELAPDTRTTRPRTLLFSPINVNYLRESAGMWADRGFKGFMLSAIMHSWSTDVWAADGDEDSRDETDALLQEVLACNLACRRFGIDSNFIKVAFYDDLPDPFDDEAWVKLEGNFREGARFGWMSGCAGIAIDTEYVSYQYHPGWVGYGEGERDVPAMKRKIRERWRTVIGGMLHEWPDMVLLTLPAGLLYYGELYTDIFNGMLEACAEADAPGGLHVLTEGGSYTQTDVDALRRRALMVQEVVAEECPEPLPEYWRRRYSVAMGAWPLGYYRSITDELGNHVGWSGREETFGDEMVGSYADKSENYPPDDFKRQMAAINTFCPRYNWIYGHGATWWQNTPEEIGLFQRSAHRSVSNAALPTVPNLQEYVDVLANPMVVKPVEEE